MKKLETLLTFLISSGIFTQVGKGPSINDVFSKGGREGGSKCWNLLSKKTTKGEGGGTSFMDDP